MTAREKVADMLAEAMRKDGCTGLSEFDIYHDIWVPSGGQRRHAIARWDVTVHCGRDNFRRIPIHVFSWATLTQISKQKKITLRAHSTREYEAI